VRLFEALKLPVFPRKKRQFQHLRQALLIGHGGKASAAKSIFVSHRACRFTKNK